VRTLNISGSNADSRIHYILKGMLLAIGLLLMSTTGYAEPQWEYYDNPQYCTLQPPPDCWQCSNEIVIIAPYNLNEIVRLAENAGAASYNGMYNTPIINGWKVNAWRKYNGSFYEYITVFSPAGDSRCVIDANGYYEPVPTFPGDPTWAYSGESQNCTLPKPPDCWQCANEAVIISSYNLDEIVRLAEPYSSTWSGQYNTPSINGWKVNAWKHYNGKVDLWVTVFSPAGDRL